VWAKEKERNCKDADKDFLPNKLGKRLEAMFCITNTVAEMAARVDTRSDQLWMRSDRMIPAAAIVFFNNRRSSVVIPLVQI